MNATAKQPISMNISALPGATTREMLADQPMRMTISKLNFWYGPKQTLFDVTLGFAANHITAMIGPSGCGKSTLLRTLNRMYEAVSNARLEGEIQLDGQSILTQDVTQLRPRVGMVFQRPTTFPKSIFDNVASGQRLNGQLKPLTT